jgi:hypothetical protein
MHCQCQSRPPDRAVRCCPMLPRAAVLIVMLGVPAVITDSQSDSSPPAVVKSSEYGLLAVDYSCGPCEGGARWIESVEASSVLDGKDVYAATKAFDGDAKTAWCEGAEGLGAGQKLRVRFTKPLLVDGGFVSGGYFKSEATLAANARLEAMRVRFAGVSRTVTFPDPAVARPLPESWTMGWFAAAVRAPATIGTDWPADATTEIEFELVSGYPGGKYQDLCISEIQLMVVDPEAL